MLQTILGLLGGLALFIFGMNLMSDSLQSVAGNRMKQILGFLTKNPILGVLAGALCTAVLQSSSATTVMAIGFVSAGLMTLPQAISVILGANIGTTITAQLLAFKISDYIYIFVFVGFVIAFAAKSKKMKYWGETIFGFGLLFVGIETMGSVMKPLAYSSVFTDMIAKVADIPVLGVGVGTLMTLVVQSSSATIAVLQNFASQAGADGSSILGLQGAIPILLGDNIGTTITALIACIGQSRNAKRTAIAHCTFNISGCLLFIWFVKPYAKLIEYISPKGDEVDVISRQIANAHTLFNITMTLIWIPLIWLMVKIVMKIVPDKEDTAHSINEPCYLNQKLVGQVTTALHLTAKEVVHYGETSKNLLEQLCESLTEQNPKKNKKEIAKIGSDISRCSDLHDSIVEYLSQMLSNGKLTEIQASRTAGLMCVLGDMERINQQCREIAAVLENALDEKKYFSKGALKDIQNALKSFGEIYDWILRVMRGEETEIEILDQRRDKILDLDIEMRLAHMNRVSAGKCDAARTAAFGQIVHGIDRIGVSCIHIAEAVTGKVNMQDFIAEEQIEDSVKSPVMA
ncbi:MAG: Na/Pi cotransporter family protein [Ruminococcus sp.]|nr:Na/Pi cotransporter family protein [Ruminococcus sp.]